MFTCPSCARRTCSDHWAATAAPPRCLECVARADEARDFDDDGRLWFHSYRHRYYVNQRYGAVSYGPDDPYYNDYDLRSFDRAAWTADDAAGLADPDAVDFGDS